MPRCGNLVGLGGFEPPTSPLSGVRSNQLSYRPGVYSFYSFSFDQITCEDTHASPSVFLLKEVIQPQVPLGLPCYDFTPVIDHTVGSVLPKG